ncbi:uncharacterized protein N7459_000071 [Penicillium hispanicum]|uniref:uncharacterized protein n=1 Tax=Penicillium hispanicum TaxID=1080232 RepID=UPI0025424039|nr:uncharacterized protein N7459_000071 [Penicillium hispanicum]KAJ5593863.1 hypothetical protein N7459_000071 [Penicillium hispanicum]
MTSKPSTQGCTQYPLGVPVSSGNMENAPYTRKVSERERQLEIQQGLIDEPPDYLYDLDALRDPPVDWLFLGRTSTDTSNWRDRSLPSYTELRVVLKIHFWGLASKAKKAKVKKADAMLALWKLFYYQAEEHRPKSWDEITDASRDTGPRLLRMDLDPTPQPYSRHHPWLPSTAASPGFVRPANAPESIPDGYVEQFLFPVTDTQAVDVEGMKTFDEAGDSGEGATTREVRESPSDRPMGRANVAFAELEPQGPVPALEVNMEPARVALERALMDILYADLRRDPTAQYPGPVQMRTALCHDDLKVLQAGTSPSIRDIVANPQTFEFSPHDISGSVSYPYRGRGPVWRANSCSIDSIIVLGILCDAGCTVIDRKDGRLDRFTDLEKAFIEVINYDWDSFEDSTSSDFRDIFFRRLCQVIPSIKMGELTPTWAIWTECTKNFAQFHSLYREITFDCPCEGRNVISQFELLSDCIAPTLHDSDEFGVDVATLIMRVWHGRVYTPCPHCGRREGGCFERRIVKLAPRLVISHYQDKKIKIVDHTEDVTFQYLDADGNMASATYRWFGGVYSKDQHVRNFWPDANRGEKDDGTICMYDGYLNSGVIIGEVPPGDLKSRVPADWIQKGFTVAVYELVKNPDDELFKMAATTLQNMHDTAQAGRYILQERQWPQPVMPEPTITWPRILPVAGEAWQDIIRNDIPRPVGLPRNYLTAPQLNALYQRIQHVPFVPINLSSEKTPYDNVFDSIDNGVDVLTKYPELWRDGQPGPEGALSFPSFPRSFPQPTPSFDPFEEFCNNVPGEIQTDLVMPGAAPPMPGLSGSNIDGRRRLKPSDITMQDISLDLRMSWAKRHYQLVNQSKSDVSMRDASLARSRGTREQTLRIGTRKQNGPTKRTQPKAKVDLDRVVQGRVSKEKARKGKAHEKEVSKEELSDSHGSEKAPA